MKRTTRSSLFAASMTLALAGCATPGDTVSNELETPRYDLVEDDGPFEIRRYAPYVVATTTVQGDFDSASRDGFRIIAGYIFGKNQRQQSIAMTAPVSVVPQSSPESSEKIAMTAPVSAEPLEDGWRITFMMPSDYQLDTLPIPDDPRVSLQTQPARCVASVRFSGFTTRSSVEKQTQALRAWMEKRGVLQTGVASVERYNDPFTLPWRRRNEVHVPALVDACPPPAVTG